MMENPKFSFYKNGITNLIPETNLSLEDTYNFIKSDENKEMVLQIRKETELEKKAILKRKLSYFTFSGIFTTRKVSDLKIHSHLICLDFDHLKNLEELKTKISQNEYVALAFISPSGDGLKLIVKIDIDDNAKAWLQLYQYFKLKYNIEADKSGKDVSRACFVSYDPSAYFNEMAKVFEVKEISNVQKGNYQVSDLQRAKLVVNRITESRTDITVDYDDWLKIGLALASFGENGRELYHAISQFHANYNKIKTDLKFDNFINTSRFTNAAFFFKKAKSFGIPITKNISANTDNQYFKNEEMETNGSVTYDLQDFQIHVTGNKHSMQVAEGFLFYIKYQTTDEHNQNTWILELKVPDGETVYLEVSHEDFFEPKNLERILGAKRLSMTTNYQQLQKIRTFLFNSTQFPKATKVLRYGLHAHSELYFFANCAISKYGHILYPDKFGIIQFKDEYYSVPQINRGQSSPFEYSETKVTFNEWYLLFSKAQREEMTFLATTFMLFSIFRDIGIKENGFSPMLFVTGIAGTAKSTLFLHLNYIFGTDGKAMGINLKGRNTEPAFVAKIEQRHNGYQFGDEYVPNHGLTSLFQASYDNKAYSKMNMNSKSYLDTTDLIPKCTLGFASNFLPELPSDEPFMSRLVVLVNNNRNRTETQKQAYRDLIAMQENGITNILKEVWQNRDLIKREFGKAYQLLKNGLETHFEKHNIGNPRYFYNLAQILSVPYILSVHGKIAMCEAFSEADILEEFIKRSEASILISNRLVLEKSALREFFDCIQELFEKAQIYETVHFKMDGKEIVINLHRLYQKFSIEFKRQNRFELQPPSITTLQDEILVLAGLDPQNEEVKQSFFKKGRFTNEIERDKIDFARNAFRIDYKLLKDNFGIEFAKNTS